MCVHPDARRGSTRRTGKRNTEMFKKLVLALVAGGIVFSAAACNTVKGAGRDVESVGKAGEDAIK
jgi:predicted small secreted protein